MNQGTTIGELIEHLKNQHQALQKNAPELARDIFQSVTVMEQLLEDLRKPVDVFIAADDFLKYFFRDNSLPNDLADWDLTKTGPWKHGPDTESALMRLAIRTYMLGSDLVRAEAQQRAASPHQTVIKRPKQITSVAALVYALKSLAKTTRAMDRKDSLLIAEAASLIEHHQKEMVTFAGLFMAADNLAALVICDLPTELKEALESQSELAAAFDRLVELIRTVKSEMAMLENEESMMQPPPTSTAH